jgi:uncharacterized protein
LALDLEQSTIDRATFETFSNKMKIDVTKLPEGREFALSETWDPQVFDLAAPGLAYTAPCKVDALVRKESGLALVRVSLQAALRLICARCFNELEAPLKKTFELAYPLDLAQKVIFLDDDIREELILSYPQKILCSQECRGLCVKCGADLNKEKCRCEISNAK